MRYLPYLALLVLVIGADSASEDNTTDTCTAEEGLWGSLLQEWALSAPAHSERHGRIMALPPAQGYYVTDRVDRPPPPPRPHHHPGPPHHSPPDGPHHHGPSDGPHHHGSPHHMPPPDGPRPYEEWQQSPPPPSPSGDGKIVNKPPKPYKDQYKPSYQSPPAGQQIPAHHPPPPFSNPHRGPGLIDRVDEPPRKSVTETDLYLLSAIEKLVYRVDLMEKRLRKMEENMHYLVAGAESKPEPCVENFTRLGSVCYHISEVAVDWKSANLQCRKLRANLLELDTEGERRQLQAAMLGDKRLRGTDVWTGGLNPGLLWIWSHSARPVAGNSTSNSTGNTTSTVTIVGEGRCLAFVHDPAYNTYVYRGQDCANRHRYICEKEEDKTRLSNEVERVARTLTRLHARSSLLLGDLDRDADDHDDADT